MSETEDEFGLEGGSKTGPRERSTIEFPYSSLEDVVAIAKAVYANHGSAPCQVHQLAAYMKQSVSSGSFRVRVSATRIFGLSENERGEIKLTELGRAIADPSQEAAARVEAFLRVPLFKALYESHKGYALPSPSALEKEIANLGVSSKQVDRARQVFMKSAGEAGFFNHGNDRLVMPATSPVSVPDAPGPVQKKPLFYGGGASIDEGPTHHPFIQGLLKELPEAQSKWRTQDRAKWLQTAASIFGLIYADDEDAPTIAITLQGPPK